MKNSTKTPTPTTMTLPKQKDGDHRNAVAESAIVTAGIEIAEAPEKGSFWHSTFTSKKGVRIEVQDRKTYGYGYGREDVRQITAFSLASGSYGRDVIRRRVVVKGNVIDLDALKAKHDELVPIVVAAKRAEREDEKRRRERDRRQEELEALRDTIAKEFGETGAFGAYVHDRHGQAEITLTCENSAMVEKVLRTYYGAKKAGVEG